MKALLLLSVLLVLLSVAVSAPMEATENKAPEAPVEALEKELPAEPEVAEEKPADDKSDEPVADLEPEEETAKEEVKEGNMIMMKQPKEITTESVPAANHAPMEATEDKAAPEAPVEALEKELPAEPEVAEEKPAEDKSDEPVADLEPEEETAKEEVKQPKEITESVSAANHAPVFEDPEEAPQLRFMYCPDGWFRHGSRCFLFVNTPMSWHNAEEHCNNLGASLTSVQDPKEYRFLQQITQTASQTSAWLGGFYLQGRWMWIDRAGFYYTNWYGQGSVSSYPCVFLRSNNGWGNSNCGTSLRFICATNPGNC